MSIFDNYRRLNDANESSLDILANITSPSEAQEHVVPLFSHIRDMFDVVEISLVPESPFYGKSTRSEYRGQLGQKIVDIENTVSEKAEVLSGFDSTTLSPTLQRKFQGQLVLSYRHRFCKLAACHTTPSVSQSNDYAPAEHKNRPYH